MKGIDALNDREVKAILHHYGLVALSWEKVGSCLQVVTDRGCFRLKCFAYPPAEFPFVWAVVNHVAESGFPLPETLLVTREGQPGIIKGGHLFYLARWREGKPFEMRSGMRFWQVGYLLGHLHQVLAGFQPPGPVHPARIQWGVWPEKLQERYRDLQEFVKQAQARPAGEFDVIFSKQAPVFLAAAEQALKDLGRLPYGTVVARDRAVKSLCHRDFIPRNLLETPEGKLVLIDFDNCAQIEFIDDVAKMLLYFARWEIRRAEKLLAGYQKWRHLQPEELQLIGAYLAFPLEYWRLGRFYYQQHRNHGRALHRLVSENDRRNEFLRQFQRVIAQKKSNKRPPFKSRL